MSEPKILFYFESTDLGDPQKSILALIFALDRDKFPFRVLVPSGEGPLAEKLRESGIEPDVLAIPAASLLEMVRYYKKLFRYFDMYPFEAVHTDGMRSSLISVGLKIRFNSLLIWQLWSLAPSGFSLWSFCWLFSVFCDHVVVGCQLVAHRMGRVSKWRNYVSILYRGYDLKALGSRKTGHSRVPTIVMSGMLAAWKGHRTFLRAIDLVRRQMPECRAKIYVQDRCETDGTYRRELEDLIDELALRKNVTIENLMDDQNLTGAPDGALAKKIRDATIYVDPSVHSESFAGALTEAMAVGVPVIASRSGVLPEFVVNEHNGLMVTGGDAGSLSEALLRLLGDEVLQNRLSTNARAEVEARFSIDRYVGGVTSIYIRLLDVAREDSDESKQSKAA